jgi:peroxiredoxin
MFRKLLFILIALLALGVVNAVDLNAQTVIHDFSLRNVDGKYVSLNSFKDKKGVVVIFTGNHCVYSKKYEDRILKLAAEYAPKNIQFILINSNSPELSEDDSFEAMQFRASEKGYPFPYLQDANQAVAKMFGAMKNPECYLLVFSEEGFQVAYSGLIDDNPLMEEAVNEKFLANALEKVIAGSMTAFSETQVQGCGIKGVDE